MRQILVPLSLLLLHLLLLPFSNAAPPITTTTIAATDLYYPASEYEYSGTIGASEVATWTMVIPLSWQQAPRDVMARLYVSKGDANVTISTNGLSVGSFLDVGDELVILPWVRLNASWAGMRPPYANTTIDVRVLGYTTTSSYRLVIRAPLASARGTVLPATERDALGRIFTSCCSPLFNITAFGARTSPCGILQQLQSDEAGALELGVVNGNVMQSVCSSESVICNEDGSLERLDLSLAANVNRLTQATRILQCPFFPSSLHNATTNENQDDTWKLNNLANLTHLLVRNSLLRGDDSDQSRMSMTSRTLDVFLSAPRLEYVSLDMNGNLYPTLNASDICDAMATLESDVGRRITMLSLSMTLARGDTLPACLVSSPIVWGIRLDQTITNAVRTVPRVLRGTLPTLGPALRIVSMTATGTVPLCALDPASDNVANGDGCLRGPLPSDLAASSPELLLLSLEGHKITGPLPSTWPLTLERLNLVGNDFRNDAYPLVPNVVSLRLPYTNIQGDWSSVLTIGAQTRLVELDVRFNHLTGEVPAALADMKKLERALLQANNLSSLVALSDRAAALAAAGIAPAPKLYQLVLRNNPISVIPEEFGNMAMVDAPSTRSIEIDLRETNLTTFPLVLLQSQSLLSKANMSTILRFDFSQFTCPTLQSDIDRIAEILVMERILRSTFNSTCSPTCLESNLRVAPFVCRNATGNLTDFLTLVNDTAARYITDRALPQPDVVEVVAFSTRDAQCRNNDSIISPSDLYLTPYPLFMFPEQRSTRNKLLLLMWQFGLGLVVLCLVGASFLIALASYRIYIRRRRRRRRREARRAAALAEEATVMNST